MAMGLPLSKDMLNETPVLFRVMVVDGETVTLGLMTASPLTKFDDPPWQVVTSISGRWVWSHVCASTSGPARQTKMSNNAAKTIFPVGTVNLLSE
jgi:hypothetical protein